MIYSKYGEQVELLSYCGKHKPKWANFPLTLLLVRYPDGEVKYQYATFLRADGGINEIDKVVDGLPERTLEPKHLKAALKQAD